MRYNYLTENTCSQMQNLKTTVQHVEAEKERK